MEQKMAMQEMVVLDYEWSWQVVVTQLSMFKCKKVITQLIDPTQPIGPYI